MIRVDVRDAISKLNSEFGYLSNDKRNLAVARAINHTMAKVKTRIVREIKSVYDIPNKYLNDALSLRKADRLTLTGMVKAKGRPLPLIALRARQVGSGVSVLGLHGRKIIPGVFIALMPGGKRGVFVRGKYSSGRIARRKHRVRQSGNDLPIGELKGVSVPRAMKNKNILRNVSASIQTMFPERLRHELQHISKPI